MVGYGLQRVNYHNYYYNVLFYVLGCQELLPQHRHVLLPTAFFLLLLLLLFLLPLLLLLLSLSLLSLSSLSLSRLRELLEQRK